MKWTKDTEEFKMFGEFYNLTKKWYEGVNSLKEYDLFMADVNGFNQKYSKCKCSLLTKKLAMALNSYVDEKYYTR